MTRWIIGAIHPISADSAVHYRKVAPPMEIAARTGGPGVEESKLWPPPFRSELLERSPQVSVMWWNPIPGQRNSTRTKGLQFAFAFPNRPIQYNGMPSN